MSRTIWTLCVLVCLLQYSDVVTSSAITFQNNAYRSVVIAINPEVPENNDLIDAIKNVWTEASQALYVATNNRAYYGEITILVPKTWQQSNYNVANKETYDAADVLVAYPNPVYQDQPYTLQYGSCGEQASYIHLTPSYLLNDTFVNDFGPKGKAIVHEWGHFRWGVFDEVYTYGYSPFYYNSYGQIEATKCPSSLKGKFKVVDVESETARYCNRNTQNGLPEDGCMFVPDEEQYASLSTSIMSNQYIDQVEKFCHNNESDPDNVHNKEAPNEQNRMCNLRSTWEVVLDSSDFAGGVNLPNNPILDTTPLFNVVRPELSRRYVLVLDTSGSMDNDNKLAQMRQVVSIFISQFVPQGDRVGIVEFDSKASTLAYLTTISSNSDRNYLLSRIPSSASGRTCIGCGLQQAISVLERSGGAAAGGNIIVFTDGAENEPPYVRDVRAEVIQKKVIVHAIFYATDANTDLQQLAEDTGGFWFFGTATNIVSILGAFKTLAEPNDGDVYSEIFQLHSSTFQVDKYSTYTGDVTIDKTVGNSTVFSFTWSQYNIAIGVVLEHPSGCTYSTDPLVTSYSCPGHPLAEINTEFFIVTFPLPGTADPGRWRYYVSSQSANSQVVTATVTSQAADRSTEPIVVTSGLDKAEAATGQAIVVYAQVSQDFAPVLGAEVLAKVERPDGSVEQLYLYDAGSAPDVRRNDGVYSRYFTGYNDAGSYAVQVTVTKTENGTQTAMYARSTAALKVATIKPDGTVVVNPNAKNYQSSNTIPPSDVGNFSRVVTGKAFEYTGNPVTSNRDYFAPNKVTDLFAVQNDVYDSSSGVVLTFTAPGSDFDDGTASNYEIRYVIGNLTELVDSFDASLEVNGSDVISGNLTEPKPAGSIEHFVISPGVVNVVDQVTLGFAVRAYDASGNVADPSNVAPVTYFYSPPDGATHTGATKLIVVVCALSAFLLML